MSTEKLVLSCVKSFRSLLKDVNRDFDKLLGIISEYLEDNPVPGHGKKERSGLAEIAKSFVENLPDSMKVAVCGKKCICGADRQINCPACGDPAPPLRVQVGILLGQDIHRVGEVWYRYINGILHSPVPDKITIEWAMQALEEYCRKYGRGKCGTIKDAGVKYVSCPPQHAKPDEYYYATIDHGYLNYGLGQFGTSPAIAICKVIVKHAESQ